MANSDFDRHGAFGDFLLPPVPTLVTREHIAPSADIPICADLAETEPSDTIAPSRLVRVVQACGRQIRENFSSPS